MGGLFCICFFITSACFCFSFMTRACFSVFDEVCLCFMFSHVSVAFVCIRVWFCVFLLVHFSTLYACIWMSVFLARETAPFCDPLSVCVFVD